MSNLHMHSWQIVSQSASILQQNMQALCSSTSQDKGRSHELPKPLTTGLGPVAGAVLGPPRQPMAGLAAAGRCAAALPRAGPAAGLLASCIGRTGVKGFRPGGAPACPAATCLVPTCCGEVNGAGWAAACGGSGPHASIEHRNSAAGLTLASPASRAAAFPCASFDAVSVLPPPVCSIGAGCWSGA